MKLNTELDQAVNTALDLLHQMYGGDPRTNKDVLYDLVTIVFKNIDILNVTHGWPRVARKKNQYQSHDSERVLCSPHNVLAKGSDCNVAEFNQARLEGRQEPLALVEAAVVNHTAAISPPEPQIIDDSDENTMINLNCDAIKGESGKRRKAPKIPSHFILYKTDALTISFKDLDAAAAHCTNDQAKPTPADIAYLCLSPSHPEWSKAPRKIYRIDAITYQSSQEAAEERGGEESAAGIRRRCKLKKYPEYKIIPNPEAKF